jgi:hypothetical protein
MPICHPVSEYKPGIQERTVTTQYSLHQSPLLFVRREEELHCFPENYPIWPNTVMKEGLSRLKPA